MINNEISIPNSLTIRQVSQKLECIEDDLKEVRLTLDMRELLHVSIVIRSKVWYPSLCHNQNEFYGVKTVSSLIPEIRTFLPPTAEFTNDSSPMLICLELADSDGEYTVFYYPITSIQVVDKFCVFVSGKSVELVNFRDKFLGLDESLHLDKKGLADE